MKNSVRQNTEPSANLPRWNQTSLFRFALLPLVVLAMIEFSAFPSISDNASVAAQVRVEAIPGRPFGVGKITVPLTEADREIAILDTYRIESSSGRVLYPSFSKGLVKRLLDQLIDRENEAVNRQITVHFLFTDDEPFDVTVHTSRPYKIRVTPRPARPLMERRLFNGWWREYNAAVQRQVEQGDYPPLVEIYLTSMLGRRLGLSPPLLSRKDSENSSELQETFELLFGIESYRHAVLRRTALGEDDFTETASYEPPKEIRWLNPFVPLDEAETPIEDIASHVPSECFYIRFGTWANQVWFDQLVAEYGGDLSRMVSLRGQANLATDRVMEQMVVESSSLTELLGGGLISDVAIIGRDTFVNEGAATAVLLEGRNALLGAALRRQRSAYVKAHADEGVSQEVIEFGEHKISFISTPDNRVRSFYVQDGKYHITSNCLAIVKRCIEAGAGQDPLADRDGFRYARQQLPLSREDTIFIYFSRQFLQGLVSPQYQIELSRRTKSITDLELIRLAELAAQAEGSPARTIRELIDGGFLPRGFGQRADGSGPIVTNTDSFDSLRGRRGYYLPVPDVELGKVTASELDFFRRRAEYYEANWRQMDPLMAGIKRTELSESLEQVELLAKLAPFGEEKFDWLISMLGEPLTTEYLPNPEDLIHAQASLKGGILFPSVPPHQIFGAIQDSDVPPPDLSRAGIIDWFRIAKQVPGYLGAFPKPGFLDFIPIGLGARPDSLGFTHSLLGLWRWQGGGYSVISFDKQKLFDVDDWLRTGDVGEPAHVRLRVGDLAHSGVSPWVNAIVFERARRTSLGNTRFLHSLTQQLRLPPESARAVAESILQVNLVCALGGDYELVDRGSGLKIWLSDQVTAPTSNELPASYEATLLKWFRGLDASFRKTEGQLVLNTSLLIQREAAEDEE